MDKGLICPALMEGISRILNEPFGYPQDNILETIKEDEDAWAHFQQFLDSYKRIRIAWPDEFKKWLSSFIEKQERVNWSPAMGGIDKYYWVGLSVRSMKSEPTKIPGIGDNMVKHLTQAGFPTIESLKGQNPDDVYTADCIMTVNRCALYCYRLAVHYANHDGLLPEGKQNWWDWKN